MVAEMTGHDTEYVKRKMAYARGLQFRTAYWIKHGFDVTRKRERKILSEKL